MIAVFLFYNQGIGKYRWFSFNQKFIHCALLCYQGDQCILFEIARTGFIYRFMKLNSVNKNIDVIKKLPMLSAYIAVFIRKAKKINEWPFKWHTCNEVCPFFSGINIGWTFNPKHLYQKLLKYKDKSNYELLAHWRRT